MSDEIWKPIMGYDGHYEISSLGRVRSIGRWYYSGMGGKIEKWAASKIMSQCTDVYGYSVVSLCINGKKKMFKTHRLVALSFIDNDESKLFVDHIDTNRQNNRVSNLRWVTVSENCNNPLTLKHVGLSNSTVLRSNRTPVAQIDPRSGTVVNTFTGVNRAARHMQVAKGSIIHACKNNTICRTYRWRYIA